MTDVALKQKHTYVEAGKKLEDASSTAPGMKNSNTLIKKCNRHSS